MTEDVGPAEYDTGVIRKGVIARKLGSGRMARPPVAGLDMACKLAARRMGATLSDLLLCPVAVTPGPRAVLPVGTFMEVAPGSLSATELTAEAEDDPAETEAEEDASDEDAQDNEDTDDAPDPEEAAAPPGLLAEARIGRAPARAIIGFDRDFVFHLVDIRLGGDPEVAIPTDAVRSVSGVDAGLCAEAAPAALEALSLAFSLALESTRVLPFRLERTLSKRPDLAPEEAARETLAFSFHTRIGDAGRAGAISLALPFSALDHLIAEAGRAKPPPPQADSADRWSRAMTAAAGAATAPLETRLHRMEIPVAHLRGLKPGDTLPLPPGVDAAVEVRVPSGALLMRGKLGAYDGKRALKVEDAPDKPAIDALLGAG